MVMSPEITTLSMGEVDRLDPEAIKSMAQAVLETEAAAITNLVTRLDSTFVTACQHMLTCRGRIVVLGMGKSGHIGSKIAATLASTGSPAFFVHPGEASHGDLGMITALDVVLALSNSGETDELLTILPVIRRLGVPLIAMTGKPNSTLANNATVHIDVSVSQEACPLGLAPTASTSAALAMGDALAISLLQARGFTDEDFARSHPSGQLGRRLLLHISDIMHTGDQIPMVHAEVMLPDAIVEMSRKGLGMTAVVGEGRQLIGVFTDGDLRRALDDTADVHATPLLQVMTRDGKTVGPNELAIEAARLMENYKIHALLVVDDDNVVVGALNIHDLLRAGVV
jgi:arabinose-5-phosphate isomerase